jgi:hypothetical protein
MSAPSELDLKFKLELEPQVEVEVEVELHEPDPEWILNHDRQVAKLMIPNPWTDPSVKKVGLYEMYIIDSLSETLELTAEENADTKLGCINPLYTQMHKLISLFLEEPTREGFCNLVVFSEKYLKRKIRLVKWNVPHKDLTYWPDIRLLETPDECLSWILRLIR